MYLDQKKRNQRKEQALDVNTYMSHKCNIEKSKLKISYLSPVIHDKQIW